MQILSATGGLASTNCYVIADPDARQAVLIDAPDHTIQPLLADVTRRGWQLTALWLTHGHFDHLADHALVRQHFPQSDILIHEREAPKLRKPASALFRLPFTIPPGEPTRTLQDGDLVTVGSLSAKVIFTPGHSPGHVCFHFQAHKLLVGGDLIIGGAIGRTDLPDSSIADLQRSLQRIMSLPDDTQLLPGHGHPSTLGHERRHNPYVQAALADQLA